MQVEMSLAELLINAIAHGRIDGVQFKRGWSDDHKTFESINAVIANRLEGARRVAIEAARRKFDDERGTERLWRAERERDEAQRNYSAMLAGNTVPRAALDDMRERAESAERELDEARCRRVTLRHKR